MDNPPYGFTETADNKIIMTAVNGLYTFDNNDQWVKEKMKLVFGNSYVDKQGRLWIPQLKGLIIRDGENETIHKDIPKVWKIIEDNDGGVWALSRNSGVKRYKDGEWQLFNEDNQLPSDRIILAFATDSGTVWIATNKGICSCTND
jgi:ligand-binding sensor domain-containing protein